jgi:transcriptional regulator GlxA family with amidase domain
MLMLCACGPVDHAPDPVHGEGEESEAAISETPKIEALAQRPANVPWTRQAAPPQLPTDRMLQVAFLVVDGVYNTELTAPFDIFHHVRFHHEPGMEVFTVSPDGEAVTTFEGLRIAADYSFADAPAADILVVPSAEHSMDTDLENRAMIQWVEEVGTGAFYIVSLCDGAFVLAEAGLLNGLAATTFPSDQDRFAEMFPEVDLRRGVSFVHHGPAVTSEGGAKSFDPAMYLVDLIYGGEVAKGVGRGLIIPWPPTAEEMPAAVIAAE